MIIQPNGKLYLLRGVKCDPDYQNTLTWASVTEQFKYFSSLAFYKFEKASDNELSYIYYGDGKIRIGLKNTSVFDCNYIMFQNPDFENKWFYAFVTSIEYVNNVTTQINFEIDVMQTWLPTISINKCFVEREHVADDTIGLHTVDEGLPVGDMVVTFNFLMNELIDGKSIQDYTIILETSFFILQNGQLSPNLKKIGGTIKSSDVVGFASDDLNAFSTTMGWVNTLGLGDGVIAIYLYPTSLLSATKGLRVLTFPDTGESVSVSILEISDVFSEVNGIFDIVKYRKLKNYTPNNNKLLTYPYCYASISNCMGNSFEVKYERLSDPTSGIMILYAQPLAVDGSLIAEIFGMNGETEEGFYSLACNTSVPLAYSYDNYAEYIALNKNSLKVEQIMQALSPVETVAGSYLSGGENGGAAKSLLSSVSGLVKFAAGYNAKMLDMDARPNRMIGSANSSTYALLKGRGCAVFYSYSVLPEYAKIVDNYLSMFGYKVLREKVPETISRKNWNYVKTVGATISGNVPADDSRKICALLDRGITFWHDPSTMLNYSLDNPIE
jgi:hypothetical protein